MESAGAYAMRTSRISICLISLYSRPWKNDGTEQRKPGCDSHSVINALRLASIASKRARPSTESFMPPVTLSVTSSNPTVTNMRVPGAAGSSSFIFLARKPSSK